MSGRIYDGLWENDRKTGEGKTTYDLKMNDPEVYKVKGNQFSIDNLKKAEFEKTTNFSIKHQTSKDLPMKKMTNDPPLVRKLTHKDVVKRTSENGTISLLLKVPAEEV